ncbi:hypothetical protein R3P38DRAFT_2801759 [Favolaschia claudopus]|uniref:Uncharacterized protein n=1 Tax=Favolaschia claudopus TaxID=2862362 RepID=A0AAV9ZVI7_9AGAR
MFLGDLLRLEEVPDEDDVSHLSSRSTITVNSLDSRFSEESETPPEDHAGLAKAAASDPATQDVYAHVYDTFSAPGKLREAPSVAAAKAAVDDLNTYTAHTTPLSITLALVDVPQASTAQKGNVFVKYP